MAVTKLFQQTAGKQLIEAKADLEFLSHQLQTIEHAQDHDAIARIRKKWRIKGRWDG